MTPAEMTAFLFAVALLLFGVAWAVLDAQYFGVAQRLADQLWKRMTLHQWTLRQWILFAAVLVGGYVFLWYTDPGKKISGFLGIQKCAELLLNGHVLCGEDLRLWQQVTGAPVF